MRFVATLLLWVLTTAALVVAIPATWAQHNLVDRNGFSQLATSAAKDPNVQSAMAGVLTTQLVKLAGSSGYDVSPNLLSGAARSYTTSSAFPGQFALANQLVHRWLFTDTVAQSDESGRWELDLSPMLSDSSFQETLANFGIKAPKSLEHSARPRTCPIRCGPASYGRWRSGVRGSASGPRSWQACSHF